LNYSSFLSFQDVDIILFLTPIDELIGPGDKMIIEKIKNFNKIAVITKLDKSNAKNAEKKAIKLKKLGFKIILGTSINIDNSIKEIINFLKKNLPKGKPFYETNEITDKSINFIIKELIRESIIKRVKDELPHSIAVLIEEFLEPSKKTNNYYLIKAFLYVERKSQKGILIGKNGNMIKSIGIESRKKIKNLLNHKIYLDLKVKIKKN
jgi:GTP-binding protein Era